VSAPSASSPPLPLKVRVRLGHAQIYDFRAAVALFFGIVFRVSAKRVFCGEQKRKDEETEKKNREKKLERKKLFFLTSFSS
jgi:hypothetical protein